MEWFLLKYLIYKIVAVSSKYYISYKYFEDLKSIISL